MNGNRQRKEKKIPGLQRVLLAAAVALAAAFLTFWAPLGRLDYSFADSIFLRKQPVDNRIKIIGIDEKTLEEYGPFSGWTRQRAADLLNAFDPEHAPAVIAFDINYFGGLDPEGDDALARAAAEYEHVVMASYVDYGTRLERQTDGTLRMNTLYVEQIEQPYEALREVTRHGFTDTMPDSDNYVRRSMLWADAGDSREYNFAWAVYENYQESRGEQAVLPKTDERGLYGFDYTAEPGMYELYSFADVAEGRLDGKVFQDSIVLVGAYSSGMMDQYMVPIARSRVMNGVEVQANHVNALLDGRT